MPERGHERLPRNFHRTFKPERQYINALLRFAASGGEGDVQAIGAATGIPTGASSGKVAPILDYCRGMGLIVLTNDARSSIKKPILTTFGRAVLIEDPFMTTAVSQWLAHMNLCSPLTGADVWYQTFVAGSEVLGKAFDRVELERYLSIAFRVEKAWLIGPMIGTYEDEAAFKTCGALGEDGGKVRRKQAPVSEEMARGYGAWILGLMAVHFPTLRQVPVTDLDQVAGWHTIPGWDVAARQRVLELVARKGLIDVDRHMEPWLVAGAVSTEQAWKKIYDDLS